MVGYDVLIVQPHYELGDVVVLSESNRTETKHKSWTAPIVFRRQKMTRLLRTHHASSNTRNQNTNRFVFASHSDEKGCSKY